MTQRYMAGDAMELDSAQAEAAAGFRALIGHPVQGPFAVWIEEPDIFGPTFELLKRLRTPRSVDLRLAKLATLVVARHWSAQFEWHTHAPMASRAGLSEEVIDALRTRQAPVFTREDEAMVYRLTRQVMEHKGLDDATYAEAEGMLGRAGLVELITLIGFFTMVAVTLNVFEVMPRNGERPLDNPRP